MGWESEEDYSKFDPKQFWAKVNGDPAGDPPRPKASARIQKIVDFCVEAHSIKEISKCCHIQEPLILQSLSLIRNMRGFSISRTQRGDEFLYKIVVSGIA